MANTVKRGLLSTLFIAALAFPLDLYPNGLKFTGGTGPIDLRTSYDVFAGRNPRVSSRLDIEFDMSFQPSMTIGYIVRVKDTGGDRVFNLFFDGQGSELSFAFNDEGDSTLIDIDVQRSQLPDMHWGRAAIRFDLARDRIEVDICGNRASAERVGLPERFAPAIVFGRSDHFIDLPTFAIRALSVSVDSRKESFPLGEHAGQTVHNSRGRAVGRVSNPEWLINEQYTWQRIATISSESVAGALYDPFSHTVYHINRQQLTTLDVRTGQQSTHALEKPCPVELTQGTCFIDPDKGTLWVYEAYREQPDGRPTVAGLDLNTHLWSVSGNSLLPTQRHHHGAWFDRARGRYTIFGGFGNMRYSGSFNSLSLQDGSWDTIPVSGGARICPRYFLSLGRDESQNAVYVFGGMGNESGEQIVGRRYLYDLHRVDMAGGESQLLWSLQWEGRNMVPVRGMVIDGESFYTLCYPEHITDSHLSLYRFSIADGSRERLADSIPICSNRITTNANIYYDDQLKRLYALVQEFDDDIASDLTVYSLSFPPITARQLEASPERPVSYTAILCVLCALVLAGVVAVAVKRRSALKRTEASPTAADQVELSNSVYLFGEFEVRDRNGRNISYMFGPKQQQALCLILQHSDEVGIPSERLSDMLWPDKADVKNLRGVTISHLRKLLKEMDGVELSNDRGMYRIVHDERFRCDVLRCRELISSGRLRGSLSEFMEIIDRGKFLAFMNADPLFDSFKKQMEYLLEPVLTTQIRKSFEQGAWRTTILLAEAMFHIDPLNDEALNFLVSSMKHLQMHDKARARLRDFATEYKKSTGADYK